MGRSATLRTVVGLPLASLAVMSGIVWAANPGRTGWIGVAVGIGLAVAGIFAAFRLFKE